MPTDRTVPVRIPVTEAEPWLLHRPAECVNAFCKPKQWCIGCDPDGAENCEDNPWPCAVVVENDPAYAAGVAAGEARGGSGAYEWAVRLKSSRGGEWVLPRDDEAHARQFVAENPPDATVVRRWISDWETP